MTITMKAVLINVSEDHRNIIDNMMLIFCTAIRYSFKRILENKKKIGEIEKEVASKYNLNIRQAKDAVENARQIIQSQNELVKIYYENYTDKARDIEQILNNSKNISQKRKNALMKKLAKRKKKANYFNGFIDSNTIPPVIFGTNKMFKKRCRGLITNEEWKACRNNRFYSRGDKTKKGNPNLRVVIEGTMSYLEISTLEKTNTNRSIKIRVPVYLPQKLSKKTGKVNGINYRQLFLNHLETGDFYQVELIKRDGKYYCHLTFKITNLLQNKRSYTRDNGVLGIDINPHILALTMIDRKGNYKWSKCLKNGELLYARTNKRTNLCCEMAKIAVNLAKQYNCKISIENLNFKNNKDVNKKFARIKNEFPYRKLLIAIESAAFKADVEVIKVNPAYTSKIGLYKYSHQFGLSTHCAAAMVIARRSYGFKEKVPSILLDKFIENELKTEFNQYNEFKKWSIISKNINKKINKNPYLWMVNRKQLLELAN